MSVSLDLLSKFLLPTYSNSVDWSLLSMNKESFKFVGNWSLKTKTLTYPDDKDSFTGSFVFKINLLFFGEVIWTIGGICWLNISGGLLFKSSILEVLKS